MRQRTVVLALAVPALLASSLATCSGTPPLPPPAVPMPAIAAQAQAPSRLKLVEGDTFPVALRASAVLSLASIPGGMPLAQTTFASSDTLVAVVVNGAIVAKDSGVATVTSSGAGAPGLTGTLIVEVQTPIQAVNAMAMEVCPNRSDAPFVQESKPLTVEHARIHEFHDCQRLIEGTRYSALVGIFAHKNVQDLEDWREYRTGRLVATVINFVGNKDPQPYAPLELPPGTSCLYLIATSESDWDAVLVPQARRLVEGARRTYESCEETRRLGVAQARWNVLEVRLQFGVDMAGDSIVPPVARWDWDEAHRHNYMGVRCGARRWCEVGRTGFTPSVPITVRVSTFGRANVIKGYYDQQYLASTDAQSPTTVFGTIQPDDDLKKHDKMKHYNVKWYDVAEITLEEKAREKSQEYRRYVRQYSGDPLFDVLLGKSKKTDLDMRPDHGATDILRLYTGRLNGKALTDGGISFHYHAGSGHGPPTVRWRWHQDDERTWSFCDPEGCCETSHLLSDN